MTLNCTPWRSAETDLWGLGCPGPLRANATPLLPPPPLLPMPRLPTQSAAKWSRISATTKKDSTLEPAENHKSILGIKNNPLYS